LFPTHQNMHAPCEYANHFRPSAAACLKICAVPGHRVTVRETVRRAGFVSRARGVEYRLRRVAVHPVFTRFFVEIPMRLLVSCPTCRRQYDASKARPGKRFHCHCGTELVVRRPRGHSATVVRCASCAAPRAGRAAACEHCGADFTIHERDMHTVCPNCLARVSDQARYCHHCATPLTAELLAGERSEYHCPVCEQRALVSRRLTHEQITVLECERCAGLWLGLETFRAMLDQEAAVPRTAPRVPVPPRGSQPGPRYRACVICGELMIRRNLGRSGVIVDLCGSHGIWFDADELSQLMAWIRAGGLEEVLTELARLHSSDDALRRQAIKRGPWKSPPPPADSAAFQPFAPPEDDPLDELITAAADFLARIFRRG
jgi:Zn-finger nucleic acid-binding protein